MTNYDIYCFISIALCTAVTLGLASFVICDVFKHCRKKKPIRDLFKNGKTPKSRKKKKGQK